MEIEKIVDYICKSSTDSPNKTLFTIFSEAFQESDSIALLQKRAFFIEHCQKAMEELNASTVEEEAFNDLFKALCHANLSAQVSQLASSFTNAHNSMVRRLFAMHKYVKKEHEVDDIIGLSNSLKMRAKNEDLTKEQKKIVLEICEAVEQAKTEHEMVGSIAIKKLMEILMGKLTIYKETLANIKSQSIKDSLKKLYTKVEEVNSVMGFILSLKSHTSSFTGMLL